MRPGVAAAVLASLVVLAACDGDGPRARGGGSGTPAATSTSSATPAPTTTPPVIDPLPRVDPAAFDPAAARRTVVRLAAGIGPRHATSPAYREAADWVSARFRAHGLAVRRQQVAVPGGDSWGVPVGPGRSVNVIATAPGLDPAAPHLVVGAHLDTVPQSPGAEDNASGVAVLLEVARLLAGTRSRLPVVLVAFGAEEPRGPTDADHHYGSRAYVASLGPAERRAVRGMVSLDRVGVGAVVPVCSAGDGAGGSAARARVVAAARDVGVPVQPCVNRSSDHWSFARAGLPGVRLGSTPYAGYHSPGDLPGVVDPRQLRRTGRVVLAWLR
jgi:hypothetical protein